jgi:hypothetical protein
MNRAIQIAGATTAPTVADVAGRLRRPRTEIFAPASYAQGLWEVSQPRPAAAVSSLARRNWGAAWFWRRWNEGVVTRNAAIAEADVGRLTVSRPPAATADAGRAGTRRRTEES